MGCIPLGTLRWPVESCRGTAVPAGCRWRTDAGGGETNQMSSLS